jgi:hypothetical protein
MASSAAKPKQTVPEGFVISRARDGGFEGGGLRQKFEYRDLDIAKATQGRFHAHVVRIDGEGQQIAAEHWHELDFQLVYILQDWIEFDYEGVARSVLKPATTSINRPASTIRCSAIRPISNYSKSPARLISPLPKARSRTNRFPKTGAA